MRRLDKSSVLALNCCHCLAVRKVERLYWGWERVFPFCGFARVVGAVSASLDTFPLVLCRIAPISIVSPRHDPLFLLHRVQGSSQKASDRIRWQKSPKDLSIRN
jgi:hypothetical protein